MTRPLARWTIGAVIDQGFETLRQSIRRFRLLYKEFDLVVCRNNLESHQKRWLDRLGVELHTQKESDLGYPIASAKDPPGWKSSMPGWGWKLVPPRLRISSHELWIDNDIVFRERLPSIDEWLDTGRSIISTGLQRAYGVFDDQIKDETPYCAGFFGLPPGLDFGERIRYYCLRLEGKPLGYYDEQGVTVSVVLENNPVIVPFSELSIIKKLTKPYTKAMHFIGVNRTTNHEAWNQYKCSLLM